MAQPSLTVDIGDMVRLVHQFVDEAGAPADPSEVVLTVRDPDGEASEVTATQPSGDPELSLCSSILGVTLEDETGVWTATVEPDAAGLWRYRWAGTGVVTEAEEGAFNVRRQRVT